MWRNFEGPAATRKIDPCHHKSQEIQNKWKEFRGSRRSQNCQHTQPIAIAYRYCLLLFDIAHCLLLLPIAYCELLLPYRFKYCLLLWHDPWWIGHRSVSQFGRSESVLKH